MRICVQVLHSYPFTEHLGTRLGVYAALHSKQVFEIQFPMCSNAIHPLALRITMFHG